MKITSEPAGANVTRIAHLTDGPVVRADGYTRSYRVDTISIRYTWTPETGRFDVDDTFDVNLAGPWVKKDNTDAKDRAAGLRPEYTSWRSGTWKTQYAWLQPVIELLRPSPGLMAFMTDRELPQEGN